MAAAFVQATNGTGDGGSTTIATSAFGVATTPGSAILVAVYWDRSTAHDLSSVTDNKTGNVYTLIGSVFQDANDQAVQFAYVLDIGASGAGAGHIVTGNITSTGASSRRIVAYEVSGLLTALSLDKDNGGSQATGTSFTDTAVVPDVDGEFIFASVMNDGGTASETMTATGSFVEPANGTAGAAGNEVATAYFVQGSAASISATWSRSGTGGHCEMRTATFRPVVSGGAAPPTFNIGFAHIGQKVRMVGY